METALTAFIVLLVLTFSGCSQKNCLVAPSATGRSEPIVGAIRWDGWVGSLNVAGLEVEHTLGPHGYHYRAPFFSKEVGYDSIECRETTQAVMDQDISYARSAGIDYWAFCWYPQNSGLDIARQLYLGSSLRDSLKWCAILGTGLFDYDYDGRWLIERFKEPNYQKVLNGRPLVYLYPAVVPDSNELAELRNMSKAAGVPDPYIVVMEYTAKKAKGLADKLGADAISCYASSYNFVTGAQYNGAAYSPTILESDEAGWSAYKATGEKIIPWVTTGWNPKPRIERSTLWSSYYSPAGWAEDGTPDQIAQNLQNALTWTKNNRNVAEANTLILYAWNEFDEGGWICPTIVPATNQINTNRIDALRSVLVSR